MTPAPNADLLTRTTLQVDGSLAGGSVAHMICALQRVPGVLLAEVNAVNGRADVAHDAAVPATSLVAAAQNVGIHVSVVGDTRAKLTGNVAAPLQSLVSRQLLIAAAAAFVVLTIVDVMVPNATQKHGILIGLTSLLWAVFVAKSFIAHRRS